MIFLSGITETLNVQTVGAGTIHYTVYYADHNATTFSANSNQGTVASAQTTVVLAAPAVNFQRQVKTVIVVNRALSAQTVIVQKVVGGTVTYLTANTVLGPGTSLVYSEECGFQVRDAQQALKRYSNIVGPAGDTEYSKNFNTSATTRIMVTNTNYLMYLGRAPRDGIKSVSVRYRVNIAGAGATVAEVGIYLGAAIGMPTSTASSATIALQCIGWVDWLANYATIGNYTSTVTVGGSTIIKEGDGIWASMFSTFATTGATIRAAAIQDITTGTEGIAVPAADRRPSLELNYLSNIPVTVQVSHMVLGYSFGY